MTLLDFLSSQNYNTQIKNILTNIKQGSIRVFQKLNEENTNIFGAIGRKNIQNEDVQKLDLLANEIFPLSAINRFQRIRNFYPS